MDESTAIEIVQAERLLREGDLAGAEAASLAIGRHGGAGPELENLLGRIALARGETDAAVIRFGRAIIAEPEAAVYRHALGNALQDQGKLDRAIAAYRKTLALRPDSAQAWNDLGTAYFAKGLGAEAEAAYRKAIALVPEHSVAHENLGALLRRTQRPREARRVLQRALWLRFANRWRRTLGRLARDSAFVPLLAEAKERHANGEVRLARALAANAALRINADLSSLARLARVEAGIGLADSAIAHLRQALQSKPGDAELHAELGDVLRLAGREQEAEQYLKAAVERAPDDGTLRRRLGRLLLGQGRALEALEVFRERLDREPRSCDANYDCGVAALSSGRLDEAQEYLAAAVRIAPGDAAANSHLGDLRRAQGRLEEAIESYQAALKAAPDSVDAAVGVALAWFSLGKAELALSGMRTLVARNRRSSRAHRHLGAILRDSGRTEEAMPYLLSAIALEPRDVEALRFLSNACGDLGRYDDARRHLEAALSLAPKRADLWNELAMLEMFCGRLGEAERCVRRAIALGPDVPAHQNNLGHVLVAQGRLEEGWGLLDVRQKFLGHAALHGRFSLPRWDGEPIAGKTLLVYAEQGLGDEIVFASCVPDLARTGARCVVECDRRLEGMFRRSFAHVDVRGGDRKKPEAWFDALDPKPDLQIGAGSLPRFFRRGLADFPIHSGYLKPDPEKVEFWRRRLASLGSALCIGLSWKGGLVRTGELRRTLSLDRLSPILRQRNVAFVSLQYTEARADLDRLQAEHGIRVLHWQEAIDSYEDTAALVCALDGVISVCTALVHLCGALGRPVWVMAPHSPGWRYRIADRNPWYPSVQLYEQSTPGDWEPVIEAVRARLAAVAAGADRFSRPP